MKFEIEKDAAAPGYDLANDFGPGRCEELRANLEDANKVLQRGENVEGTIGRIDIEGDDQFVFCDVRHCSKSLNRQDNVYRRGRRGFCRGSRRCPLIPLRKPLRPLRFIFHSVRPTSDSFVE